MIDEKKNDDVIFISNETKIKFFKQLLRKKKTQKTCTKKTFMKISRKNYFKKSKKFKLSINTFT